MLEEKKLKLVLNGEEKVKVLQTVIEEDLIIPDVKPDVNNILQVDGEVHIKDVKTESDKINYMGIFEHNVLYVGDDENKSINSVMGEILLDDYIDYENMDHSKVNLECDVEHVEYAVINSRKMHVKAVINIKVKMVDKKTKEIIQGVNEMSDTQSLKKTEIVDEYDYLPEQKISLKDMIMVTSNKPSIRNILKCTMKPNNMEYTMDNGMVNVRGNLHITILYKNFENESSMEFFEHDMEINENIESELYDDIMISSANAEVQDKFIEVSLDDDGEERILNFEVVLNIKIKTIKTSEMEIIDDIYSLNNNLKITKENINYDKMYLKNKNKYTLKEFIKISEDDNILQIYNIDAYLKIEDIDVSEDSVDVYGVMLCKILYVVADDENPIKSFEKEVPFMQKIDANGITDQMKVDLNGVIEYISYSMISQNELEIRFVLTFDILVKENKIFDVITDITEMENEENEEYPSMIIYIVKPNDNMWNVAKKYKTTVEELMDMNEVDNPDYMEPGTKLVIIKK